MAGYNSITSGSNFMIHVILIFMGKIVPSSYMQCMYRMHALDYSIVQKIGRYKEREELQHHLASGAASSIFQCLANFESTFIIPRSQEGIRWISRTGI